MRNRLAAIGQDVEKRWPRQAKWARKRWPWLLLAFAVIVGLVVYLNNIRTTVGLLQWSGFQDKTLWNVLELLIVPSVLAIAALIFNQQLQIREDAVENDRQREGALQNYLDKMTELLLEKELRLSENDSEVRAV